MPRLTPEQRYERLLNESWWRFQRHDTKRMLSIRKLLEQAEAELTRAILNMANEDGTLPIERMEWIRRQLQDTMGRFRVGYQYRMEDLLAQARDAAFAGQIAALDGYGGIKVRFLIQLDEVSQRVSDIAHKRTFNGLSLSDRIWRLDIATRNYLERDILNSIMEGRSAATMARRIGKYLLPGRELPKKVPSSAYSGQPADVSYNAYRLARTEINQTWHEARRQIDIELAEKGIALGSRWVLSPNHKARMLSSTNGKTDRDICDDWAERLPGSEILKGQPKVSNAMELKLLKKLEEYGIDPHGVYLPGQTPLDHPNGLCTTATVLIPRDVQKEQLQKTKAVENG